MGSKPTSKRATNAARLIALGIAIFVCKKEIAIYSENRLTGDCK